MLIDLYERPYSPEAPKSRAFIDRILALSGPDGGVVGGEDGVSTQRPLKDGGREAWDMIRRLRQKAWQKAGLNPHMLWTEQDQIQAGIAAGEPHSLPPATSRQPAAPDRQLSDFNKTFYNITRSHSLLNPASSSASLKPSPLRNSHQLPPPTPAEASHAAIPAAVTMPGNDNKAAQSAMATSPVTIALASPPPTHSPTAPSIIPVPPPQAIPDDTYTMPSMDPTSPVPPTGVPTPPSMVDPNLTFDWDQWDAVFGQHLPVADELMELDPVSGLEFNFGVQSGDTNTTDGFGANGLPTVTTPGDVGLPPAWTDPGSVNPEGPSSGNWTGYS